MVDGAAHCIVAQCYSRTSASCWILTSCPGESRHVQGIALGSGSPLGMIFPRQTLGNVKIFLVSTTASEGLRALMPLWKEIYDA